FAVALRRGEPPAAGRDLYPAAQDAGGVVSPALLQVEPRTGARGGRFDPSGADEEVVGHRVLIAAELERLLEPDQLAGLDVTWLPTEQPTPSGDYVALVPLLSRDRKSTRLNSSHVSISYAVFCLKKKSYSATQLLAQTKK